MARRVLDRFLDSKEARRRLAPRAKPYFRAIERGLHLGYRRLATGAAGPWVARHYLGDGRYEEEAIGHADDLSDADGVAILNYWQAVEVARERMRLRVHAEAGITGPYTVADAVAAYLEFLEGNRKTAYDVRKAHGGARPAPAGQTRGRIAHSRQAAQMARRSRPQATASAQQTRGAAKVSAAHRG